MSLERTLVILKPDAAERNLVSEIVSRFTEMRFKIIAWKKLLATAEHLKEHFPVTEQWVIDMGSRARKRVREEKGLDPTKFFEVTTDYETGMKIIKGCHDYYVSGPLIVFVLERDGAISFARTLIGNTLPSKAEKGTIRGDYGVPENLEKLRGGAVRNLVHASDAGDAEREIRAWFNEEELRKVTV